MTLAEFNKKFETIAQHLIPQDKINEAKVKVRTANHKTFGIGTCQAIESFFLDINSEYELVKFKKQPTYIIHYIDRDQPMEFNKLYHIMSDLEKEEKTYDTSHLSVYANVEGQSDHNRDIDDMGISVDVNTDIYTVFLEVL